MPKNVAYDAKRINTLSSSSIVQYHSVVLSMYLLTSAQEITEEQSGRRQNSQTPVVYVFMIEALRC